MENATKALLIAAAVLIAILLISFGVYIINNTRDIITNNQGLDELEIDQFNQKFTQYEGTSVSGSKANSLLRAVFNHNMTQEDESRKVTVTVDGTEKVGKDDTTAPTAIPTGARYTIVANYDTKSHLITSITVTTNSSTSKTN